MQPRGFSLGSAMGGLAIGAVLTFVAMVAVVPGGGSLGGRSPASFGVLGPGEDGEFLDEELAGDEFYVDEQGNIRRVTESSGGGARTRTTSGGSGGSGGGSSSTDGGSEGTEGRAGGGSGSGSNLGGGGSGGAGSGASGGGGPVECAAGRNGGATDEGVSATQIKLGATVAESGIAKSFLGEVRQGMEAQVKKINRAGGVCGRQLRVIYKDDGWKPDTGANFIRNLVEDDKVFALAVSPSSEGVDFASKKGDFRSWKVPVVGADGLVRSQFQDPYIFPVAAATTTTINIMMKKAADRVGGGANLKPAVVYGKGYRFGIEGAFAANEAYKKVSGGKSIPGYEDPLTSAQCKDRFCGVDPGQGQYGTQVSEVKDACGSDCNFMILLLEPKTAQDWMAVPGVPIPSNDLAISAPQPLFTHDFARNCSDKCHGMWLWTGYNPPIDKYQGRPGVATYVSDLKAQSASADEFNQFTMGGYLGMQLLIEALKQTGPSLTRAALVDKLNSMGPLDTGLSVPLQWRANARYANHSAQAFKIEAAHGFSNWTLVQEPIRDIWLGQHAG